MLSATFMDFVDNVSLLGLRGSFRCLYFNRGTSSTKSCKETICPEINSQIGQKTGTNVFYMGSCNLPTLFLTS